MVGPDYRALQPESIASVAPASNPELSKDIAPGGALAPMQYRRDTDVGFQADPRCRLAPAQITLDLFLTAHWT
jgi:hypothetical protein